MLYLRLYTINRLVQLLTFTRNRTQDTLKKSDKQKRHGDKQGHSTSDTCGTCHQTKIQCLSSQVSEGDQEQKRQRERGTGALHRFFGLRDWYVLGRLGIGRRCGASSALNGPRLLLQHGLLLVVLHATWPRSCQSLKYTPCTKRRENRVSTASVRASASARTYA